MSWSNVIDRIRAFPRHFSQLSLATRLTALYTFSAFTIVAIASAALDVSISAYLEGEERSLVVERMRALQTVVAQTGTNEDELRETVERDWPNGTNVSAYVRVLDSKGRRIAQTSGMDDYRLVPRLFPRAPVSDGELSHASTVSHFALYSVALTDTAASGSISLTAQIAVNSARRIALLASYRRRMWMILAAALAACLWAGSIIARRGLFPVREMGSRLRLTRSTTLHERLDTHDMPLELRGLAQTCNEMLDGLHEAFAQLSRFSADIAHELRTPLNNLRGEIDVAISRPRSAREYQSVMESCLEECDRMGRLIESLLFLARAEGEHEKANKQLRNLRQELRAVVDFYEPLAAELGVTLSLDTSADTQLEVDRAPFQSALGNLVENALAATQEGGSVTLRARDTGEGVDVDVIDTGCGIPSEHIPHVFDALYRIEVSRARSESGAGLGLAIVKSIAALHNGSVTMSSEVGSGTRVTLRLPRQ